MKRIAFVLLIATLSLAAAKRRIALPNPPSAPTPSAAHYRGGPTRSGVYDSTCPRVLHGRKWLVQIPGGDFSPPVYANGTLYLVNGAGRVTAYDANSGVLRWTSPFLDSNITGPTITSDAVYVGIAGRAVIALSIADGRQIARFDVDREVFATPLIETDTLFVATESGALFAFDPATRQQKWRFAGPGPAHGHPAGWNGGVIYGSGPSLVAVDGNGHERWRFTGTAAFFSPSLAISGGVAYGSDFDGHFYAIDAASGSLLWTYSGSSFSAPIVSAGLVIVGTVTPPTLLALNASSGTVAWQVPLPHFIEPIAADGTIYGGTYDLSQGANSNATQKILAFDLLSGQQLWSFDVVGQVASGTAVGDGKFYVETQARNVYAIE